MRTKVIKADSIDAAAKRILDELKEDAATSTRSISSRNNVIYFDGWDGLGASAVLRAVAQRLTALSSSEAPAGLKFDQIIHIDCSKWESKRALQRAVAEQLELPAPVMDMFDRQDEEDDFLGIHEVSRTEIPHVLSAMFQRIQELNRRFLVIFHNGSTEAMHPAIIGFLLFGYSTNKVLWTFQGQFRLYPMRKVQGAMESSGNNTDVLLSAAPTSLDDVHEFWSFLVREEAAEVVASLDKTGCIISHPSQVIDCFSYMSKLCYIGYHFRVDYDLATHCWNYMICDGIIMNKLPWKEEEEEEEEDNDGPWQAAQVLQREMRLDADYYRLDQQSLPSHLVIGTTGSMDSMPHWGSPLYGALFTSSMDPFQVFAQLGVLKLSRCNFNSSSSPPFHYYPNMKFLWIDQCHGILFGKDNGELNKDIHQCFQRLWVLDIRYTSCDQILHADVVDHMTQLKELNVVGAQDWDISQLQGRLPNIRKLQVTKSTVCCSSYSKQYSLFSGMNKMEVLDFSGNRTMQGVRGFSEISTSNSSLDTVVIIGGCVGIHKFSFRGCAKLNNLLLSGLFEDLRILDLSGTIIKTVDLSAMIARSLDELFLDDCPKLCAILWPQEDKMIGNLNKLHIDTTLSAASLILMQENSTEGSTTTDITTSSSTTTSLSVVHGGRAPSEFDWCIRVRDARLLRSLVPFKKYFDQKVLVHVEIYSPSSTFSSGNDNNKAAAGSSSSIKQQHVPQVKVDKPTYSFVYADVEVNSKDHPLLQPSKGDVPMLTQMWPCPSIPSNRMLTCYTHIQDHQLSTKSLPEGEQTMTSIIIPDMICYNAFVLHVHDSLSITSIPGPAPALGSTWRYLNWCRVERCPMLEHAFTAPQLPASGDVLLVFYSLSTLWASELSKARYIWNWTLPSVFRFQKQSFEDFKLLHMDLCPRVIHVLPLALEMVNRSKSLRNLNTLEIMWCGDLREVFPLYTKDAKSGQRSATTTAVHFQYLKLIHLHELPKLQGICGQWRICAPELEAVKIRGCWSLKRLPAVGNITSKKVKCDCEKEWWDTLEWDGLDANHHPSLYNLTHPRYYKKTMLKSSVLR